MEDKIAHGNKEVDLAKKQALAIRRKELEIEEAARQREQAQEAKQAIEDEQDFLRQQSNDLDKELQNKSAKLEKLQGKYHEIKQEAEDIQAENQREREQLLETIRELTRHIQLKDFILDNFVPREETEKVENRAYWDEEADHWLLHPTDYQQLNYGIKRPGSAKANLRRPTSDFALASSMRQFDPSSGSAGDGGPRFRAENILELELDMPIRTTQDYSDGSVQNPQDAYAEQNAYELQMAQQAQQAQMNRSANSGMMQWQQQQYR